MADPQYTSVVEPNAGFRAWRTLVEKSLKGRDFSALQSRTRDGIVIDPLYPPRPDGAPLPGRGPRPWTIVQILDHPDPERANEQALADILGGATGLCLRFTGASLAGARGLPPTAESLAIVLDGVDLAALNLHVDPHSQGPEIAGWLRDLVAKRSIAPELTRIAFGLDPVARLVQTQPDPDREGRLPALFSDLARSGFKAPIAELDARPFHEAGATEAQELAAILACAVWWLRALEKSGHSAETSLPLFGASLSVDHDQFVSIVKIRALRLLWARLAELCAVPPIPLRIHAQTSRRMMARAGSHTNLVRATIAAFAAGVAGADSIAVLPYSEALGNPAPAARALARNTHLLLLEEAHIYRVADPAAGSGALEALTASLAEQGWTEFQEIEREGGIIASLCSGAFPQRIAAAREALRADVASGAVPIVGAVVYRDPGESQDLAPDRPDIAGLLAPVRLEEMAV